MPEDEAREGPPRLPSPVVHVRQDIAEDTYPAEVEVAGSQFSHGLVFMWVDVPDGPSLFTLDFAPGDARMIADRLVREADRIEQQQKET